MRIVIQSSTMKKSLLRIKFVDENNSVQWGQSSWMGIKVHVWEQFHTIRIKFMGKNNSLQWEQNSWTKIKFMNENNCLQREQSSWIK